MTTTAPERPTPTVTDLRARLAAVRAARAAHTAGCPYCKPKGHH